MSEDLCSHHLMRRCFHINLLKSQTVKECMWAGWCPGLRCSREGRALETLLTGYPLSHISSPAGRPSPAHHLTSSGPAKPSDPSVPVAVTSGQCHPQQRLMSSPGAPSIQGPKSSASSCPMTRWAGVRTGHSIVQSATPTLQ